MKPELARRYVNDFPPETLRRRPLSLFHPQPRQPPRRIQEADLDAQEGRVQGLRESLHAPRHLHRPGRRECGRARHSSAQRKPRWRAGASRSAISSPTISPPATARARPPSSPRSFRPPRPTTGASPSSNSITRSKRPTLAWLPSAAFSRLPVVTAILSAKTKIATPRKSNSFSFSKPTR